MNDTLVVADVIAELERAEFRLVVETPFMVIAERAIAGLPRTSRVVFAQADAAGAWRARMMQKVPATRHGRAADYLPLYDRTGRRLERLGLRDALHFGLWLGGALSCPVGPAEAQTLARLA